MRHRRRPIEDLRTAIDCLPGQTRVAMLEGVRRWPIIVGAYTDRGGGVCPMLAAHRCGGGTHFLALSRARGRYTHAQRPRPAPPPEGPPPTPPPQARPPRGPPPRLPRAVP